MRKYRKQEYIENYLRAACRGNPLFKNVSIEHDSMPDFAYDDIDARINFMGKEVAFPLIINAVTGGTDFAENINKNPAQLAKDFNILIVVGSQTVALEDDNAVEGLAVVREIIEPQGLILANISGLLGLEEAERAADMVQVGALQTHLSPGQELIVEEGDRDFKSIRKSIKEIVQDLDIPVIVKEVGFGMNPRVIQNLYNSGVRTIDLADFRGTNSFEVENLKCPEEDSSEFFNWSSPTALCLLWTGDVKRDDLALMESGGIRGAEDCLKAMTMEIDICVMSGELLSYLIHGGYGYAHEFLDQLIRKMKILMMLTNCRQVQDIHKLSYRIKGDLKGLYEGRQQIG